METHSDWPGYQHGLSGAGLPEVRTTAGPGPGGGPRQVPGPVLPEEDEAVSSSAAVGLGCPEEAPSKHAFGLCQPPHLASAVRPRDL